jgi:hypothetical protein
LGDRALLGLFRQTLQSVPIGPLRQALCLHVDTKNSSERLSMLGMPPAMREWIGGRQARELRRDEITVELKKYEDTLEFALEDLDYDNTGQLVERIREFGQKAEDHWASLIIAKLLLATAETGYDNQYFFDTDHSHGDSGTMLNLLAAAQVTELNVATAAAPTADEAASALLGAVEYMASYLDDQGEPCNEMARNFMVVGPINLMNAFDLAISKNLLNTATGAHDNPIKALKYSFSTFFTPRLTGTTVFYVFRTDASTKSFITMDRGGVTDSMKGRDSDFCFDNDAVQIGIKAERALTYGEFRDAVHCTLS